MKYLFLALFSFSSFAHTNEISDLLATYGQETKYEVLKNAFESTFNPALASDFEMYTDAEKRKQICVMATETKPEELTTITVARFSKKVAGTPANGPLFPGTPERWEEKVIVGQDYWLTRDPFFEVFQNHLTNTDFVVRVPKNNQSVYSDLGGEVSIFFRRGPNYISFKIQSITESNGPLFPSSVGKTHFYGYCYQK
jgi:hypothetical protein